MIYRTADPEAEAAEWTAIAAEWGVDADLVELVAGSFSVVVDSREVRDITGMTRIETNQTLTFETVRHRAVFSHTHKRRWLGDQWDEPYRLPVAFRTI